MGALHQGHLSLIKKAADENDKVVCSIFVNPTQFNNPKDLEKYPRMPEADIKLLADNGCDYVFLPSVDEMYPADFVAPEINLGAVAEVMEGKFRPGHFNGVAIVVDRFFSLVDADAAYFGEKDFQQLAVIRKMTALRNHRVKVIGCATMREDDGLAMSSRNMLLDKKQRAAAPLIYQALQKASAFIPYQTVEGIKDLVIRYIEQSPLLKVEYFELVDTETLQPVSDWKGRNQVQGCVAVLTSGPRLIDNIRYHW